MPDNNPAHIFKHQKACAKTSNTLRTSRIALYSTKKRDFVHWIIFDIFIDL